jgi:hypothetical protein
VQVGTAGAAPYVGDPSIKSPVTTQCAAASPSPLGSRVAQVHYSPALDSTAMSDWTPQSDDNSPDDQDESDPSVARVMTLTPVAVRLVATPHPRQPQGHTVFRALGAVDGDVSDESPVLAQGSLPEAMFDAVQAIGLFDAPVPLLLSAQEHDGGIRGVLSAIVPQRLVERAERLRRSADEPWLASVAEEPDTSSFVEPGGDEEEGEPHVPFALGVILRFPEDRKHPEALDEEAMDLLATILSGQAMDADRKRVENLLKSL